MKKNKPALESILLAVSQAVGISIGVCANGSFDGIISVVTCALAPVGMAFYGLKLRRRLSLSLAVESGRGKRFKRLFS